MAQIRTVSLPELQAAYIDQLAARFGGRSAAMQAVIEYYIMGHNDDPSTPENGSASSPDAPEMGEPTE